MIRGLWLFLLFSGTLAWTQVMSTERGQMAAASTVGPESPVLTIQGLCAEPKPKARTAHTSCKTVVSRSEFERLAEAVEPEAKGGTKHQLASAYAQFLVMVQEAHKRGLDKNPRFKERLAFARLQILSQELVRQIQEEAAQVPGKDITAYYQEHLVDFEEASVERIVVPRQKRTYPHSNEQDMSQSAAQEMMTKEAEALRVRAAAGEDFIKLQTEAYAAAGASGSNSPNPSLGKLRRRGLPPSHVSVFDLKPGQVSQVLSDTTGHYIYKIDSKEIVPLDTVKQEISKILKQQRIEKTMEGIQQPFTTDFNQAYFGADVDTDSD
jgi:hypothetical protein